MQPEGRRQFRIGRCLGRGGFGEVYRATMRSPGGLETVVALKVLRSDLELDADAIGRLRDEGRLLARINHPVVVRAYDLTSIDGRIGLVTEFVDGDDLDGCMRKPGHIEVRALVQAIGQVAGALDAASTTVGPEGETLRIVHRDVKPTNVRIGRHGQVKLLDFGIARFQAPDRESRTVSDVVVGSVPYMAPERFGERASLPAGDVFGLGCCLFEGAAGRRFHREGSLRSVSVLSLDADRYLAHLGSRLAELHTPEVLSDLIGSCLQFDPTARPLAREIAVRCEAMADRLSGATLRRWCADRTWADPPPVGGDLEGRTVSEGSLVLPAPSPTPKPAGVPKLVQRPLGTIDPQAFDAMELSNPPRTPGGPPPLPSLPVGVTLLEGAMRIVDTDSTSRPRVSDPPSAPPARRRGPVVVLVGCAAVAVLAVLALLVGGLVGAWLGLG